jgi:hypothetical protein
VDEAVVGHDPDDGIAGIAQPTNRAYVPLDVVIGAREFQLSLVALNVKLIAEDSDRKSMSASRRRSESVPRKQSKREQRISDEIVVDAYGPEERAMGWYYYLESNLGFPLQAQCISRRATSPLRVGEIVTIVSLTPEEDCTVDMIVLTRLGSRTFGVPLSQLKPGAPEATNFERCWAPV